MFLMPKITEEEKRAIVEDVLAKLNQEITGLDCSADDGEEPQPPTQKGDL